MQTYPLEKLITLENWTFCRFRLDEIFVYISYGGEAHPDPSREGDILEKYFITMQNEQLEEFFQREFLTLEEAIQSINESYSDWDFENQDELAEQGGCGNCQAH